MIPRMDGKANVRRIFTKDQDHIIKRLDEVQGELSDFMESVNMRAYKTALWVYFQRVSVLAVAISDVMEVDIGVPKRATGDGVTADTARGNRSDRVGHLHKQD